MKYNMNDIEKLLQKIQNINSNDIVILSGNIPKCINENIFFWNSVHPGVVGVRRKFLPSGRLMNGLKIVWCLSPFI